MFERSAEAPQTWAQHDTEAYIRQVVLLLEPDVVMFQELPGQVPFIETHDMIRSNPRSHSGNLATLVRHQLLDPAPTFSAVERCALLTTLPAYELTIANVHLSPGRGSELERRHQIQSVVEASPTDDLLIAGDTNSRVDEVDDLASELQLGAPKPPKPTWDSKRNRFRPKGHEFSAYFTRCFSSGEATVSELVVHREPVSGEMLITDEKFYVSDHFALSGLVTSQKTPR